MKRQDRRSRCPLNFSLQVLGDTWTLLIIRDIVFAGKRTYTEFLKSEEGISTNILADRLRRLVAGGILRKEGRGRTAHYSLTAKGLDLIPVVLALIEWGAAHDPDTAAPASVVERIRTQRDEVVRELRERLEQ